MADIKDIKAESKVSIIMSNTIEDIFKVLLKMLENKEQNRSDMDFLKSMKDDEKVPILSIMEATISKRYCAELEKHHIPYIRYEVVGTAKDVIVISPEDKERAITIENGMRIQAGLEIDSKAELDRAMAVMYPNELEQRYDGLTKQEAECIIQMGLNAKKPITIVSEMAPDNTYSVFCRATHAPLVSRFVLDTICNHSNHSKEMEAALKSQAYFQKERTEFLNAIQYIRDTSRAREGYLFSLNDRSHYIMIKEDSFDIVRNGKVVRSMNMASNPALYPDVLKFVGNSLDYPVYKTYEEVVKAGGVEGVFRQADQEIACKDPDTIFSKNLALKQWISEKTNIDMTSGFNMVKDQKLNINDFVAESKNLSPAAKEAIMRNPKAFQAQLDEIQTRFASLSTQKEVVHITIDDVIRRADINYSTGTEKESKRMAYENTLYDTRMVADISSGKSSISDLTEVEMEPDKLEPRINEKHHTEQNKGDKTYEER